MFLIHPVRHYRRKAVRRVVYGSAHTIARGRRPRGYRKPAQHAQRRRY